MAPATFEPGGLHEHHRHPNGDEFLFILEGGGEHLTPGSAVRLDAGEIAYIPAGEYHGYRNKAGALTRTLFGYFGAGSLEEAGYEVREDASRAPSPSSLAAAGHRSAAALRLAADGYDIGVTYNSGSDRAAAVIAEAQRLGARAVAVKVDLRMPELVAPVLDRLVEEFGRVDVLVNNAGINHRRDFPHLPLSEWQEVIATNLTGAFVSAQTIARRMVAQGKGGAIG